MTINLAHEQTIGREFTELLSRNREAIQHAINIAQRTGDVVDIKVDLTVNPADNSATIAVEFERPTTATVRDSSTTEFDEEAK